MKMRTQKHVLEGIVPIINQINLFCCSMLHFCEGSITSYPRQSTKYAMCCILLAYWLYQTAHHDIDIWEHRHNAHIKHEHMRGGFSLLTIIYGEIIKSNLPSENQYGNETWEALSSMDK